MVRMRSPVQSRWWAPEITLRKDDMAKKGPRKIIKLECTECKQRNYTTMKNDRNTTDKLELKKYCKKQRKSTVHKEVKAS